MRMVQCGTDKHHFLLVSWARRSHSKREDEAGAERERERELEKEQASETGFGAVA